jgi:hypothetical protein
MATQSAALVAVPVRTASDPPANPFDFEKALENLEEAFVQLHEFWPREKSPFSPRQYAAAVKLVNKCSHVAAAFYNADEDGAVL